MTCGDKTTRIWGCAHDLDLSIGRGPDNAIVYPSPLVSARHATLAFRSGTFTIRDHNSSNGVFLNDLRLAPEAPTVLSPGDTITLLALRITIGDGFISLNSPDDAVRITAPDGLVPFEPPTALPEGEPLAPERPCFYPALRFVRSIEPKEFVVDAPPAQEPEDDTPLAMRIGPSLVMALASILSASVSVTLMMGREGSLLRAIPLCAMAFAMLVGSVLWPLLNKRFQRRRRERIEAQRCGAYAQYLGKVRSELQREASLQQSILEESRVSPQACLEIARTQDARFMARIPLHRDYLELRLGWGDVPLEACISFPDIRFELNEDDLRGAVEAFAREPQVLTDVPLAHSLLTRPILGLVGTEAFTDGFLRNLIVQACALHSYEDVKVVFLGDEAGAERWSFLRYVPHGFSDDKAVRYFAASLEEANELGMGLVRTLEARLSANGCDARAASPQFILVCPSKAIYDRLHAIKSILAHEGAPGFMVIACAESMHELPIQCRTIVEEGSNGSAHLLDRDDPTGARRPFKPDASISLEDARRFASDVAAARIDLSDSSQQLPDRLSFLEMFGVPDLENLGVLERWRSQNASDTLAAPIGVDAAGDALILDLHESVHGPHGLIAGTTGSGKSELIITYVLSMAINFAPDEVAFVLIDYKGGGLAKAFDNERFRLPHIAGTITNLDGAAIARSLSSIKSELCRRQQLFNEAREVVGGDNVDIYGYLDLYRQGRVSEPCPHLIIVADEFAELKQQEPEFMDELISASRIGRSLGVHLILATQKPSGVVNDQIWSNARFKIALKVADAADSQEIIKRVDAAEITQPGRFFLLVGYNELFSIGQSGYAGAPYDAQAQATPVRDQAVSLISNTGRVLLSVTSPAPRTNTPATSQIVAISQHLVSVAADLGTRARPLWLPPLPAFLRLDDLLDELGRTEADGLELSPVIGMYDDPERQSQHLLGLPLLEEGNAIIYGSVEAGAEQVVRTLLYAALAQHTARTLHAYVIDLGSQSLAPFAAAPQVGDVILMGQDEKMERFFGFMGSLMAERRARLAPFGGSFARYGAQVGDLPVVLIVVNGMAAFLETYPAFEEALVSLAREASQVGVRLVVVGETPNAVRMRMKSYFRQILACDMPDSSDHVMIFGSLNGVAAPHGFGRGFIKLKDGLFEFQAARLCPEDESEYDAIATLCAKLAQASPACAAAPAIPLPPSRVLPSLLAEADVPEGAIPYGIFDDTLGWATLNLAETALLRCVGLKAKTLAEFVWALIQVLTLRRAGACPVRPEVVVLDMARMLDQQPEGCAFATRKDELAISYLRGVIEHGVRTPTVMLISGIADLLGRAPFEAASLVKDYLKGLQSGEGVTVILFDTVASATYGYEDWFKAHLTSRDGLWLGPGIESQSAINIAYSRQLLPDAKMHARLGYLVEGGLTRLVHLASFP